MRVTQFEYVWKVIPYIDLFQSNIHKEIIGKKLTLDKVSSDDANVEIKRVSRPPCTVN